MLCYQCHTVTPRRTCSRRTATARAVTRASTDRTPIRASSRHDHVLRHGIATLAALVLGAASAAVAGPLDEYDLGGGLTTGYRNVDVDGVEGQVPRGLQPPLGPGALPRRRRRDGEGSHEELARPLQPLHRHAGQRAHIHLPPRCRRQGEVGLPRHTSHARSTSTTSRSSSRAPSRATTGSTICTTSTWSARTAPSTSRCASRSCRRCSSATGCIRKRATRCPR